MDGAPQPGTGHGNSRVDHSMGRNKENGTVPFLPVFLLRVDKKNLRFNTGLISSGEVQGVFVGGDIGEGRVEMVPNIAAAGGTSFGLAGFELGQWLRFPGHLGSTNTQANQLCVFLVGHT